MWGSPCGQLRYHISGRGEADMPKRQLEALMWEQACEAMERAQRLHRQFFHRSPATPAWEAPCDIFESEEVLANLIALPGVEPHQIKATLSARVLLLSGERPLPSQLGNARGQRLLK